jgi:ribonuclease HI
MIVYFDGGCTPNPGKMKACVVLCPVNAKAQIHVLDDLGQGTNNLAEWAALILAVTLIQEQTGKVAVLGDSQLVVNQANGVWRIKQEVMQNLCLEYQKLARQVEAEIEVAYVPREKNLAGRYLEHGHL